MTRCPNCSGENAETQRFCGECGTPLPSSVRTTPVPRESDETILLPTAELPPGTLFARRYQVIEELGAGGMGRVYRVHDAKLGEEIALKVIRPDVASDRQALERFSSELKLARQVVHRNVARMFDLNEEGHVPFITMEYVRGENLKRLIRKVGRLAPGQAIPIACQICGGLDEAHRLGIVHRDLKPQNVMIDEDGQARILDFGLARLLAGRTADERVSRSGTPAYISPEQVRRLPVDGRSDLYSMGVLLYEMLTGKTPFQAESVDELLEMHLSATAPDPRALNPGVSAELSGVVMKCLEKDPAARYQSAAEVRAALERLSVRAKPSPVKTWLRVGGAAVTLAIASFAALFLFRQKPWEPSLAVLPIEGTVTEARQRSLLSGLQSEITSKLTTIPGLRVIPRLSVDSYDLTGKSSPQIGKLLGAKYLLSVKLDFEGGRVDARITLIDAKRDSFPPPYTYTKDSPDYRALQDEIARYTAGALGKVIAEEKLKKNRRRETSSIEAYSLYLEGMALVEKQNDDADIRQAIAKFEAAIRIDPGYALAYWGAGNAYENLCFEWGSEDPSDLEKMFAYFSRASEIDPTFAETNLGLGWYYFNKRDNPRAFAFFKKALELEPDSALVNRDSGAFLMSIGLYAPAIRRLSRAASLSPRDALALTQISQCYLYLGQSEEALAFAQRAIAIDHDAEYANAIHIMLLILTGRLSEARREADILERFARPPERLPFLRGLIAALSGDRKGPPVFEKDKPNVSPQGTYIYLLFGMTEEALANIRTGIDLGLTNGMYYYSYPSLVKNPRYKSLRDDPRFRAILKEQKEVYTRELKALEKL